MQVFTKAKQSLRI